MESVLRVLLIEDSEDDVKILIRELRRSGYDPLFSRVDTREAMAAALDEGEWDIVICDYNMPEFSAPHALALLQDRETDIPFIVVSGAHDYIMKNNLTRLVAAIERELREAGLRRQRKDLEKQLLHAQKMEAVGRLAGGVAHDFNNILTPIIAYTELILASQSLEGRALSHMQEVHKAAARATELVRQLLAFSRKEIAESQVFSPKSVC
jgi:signal transduction histidine kinase